MAGVNKAILVELRDLYETQLQSIPQIAERLGWPRSRRVRNRLMRIGLPLRSRVDGIRLRSDRIAATSAGRVHPPRTAETREKIARARRSMPAKGTRITSNGYIEFTRGPHKGRLVHDVLIEQEIGRRLAANELVHHVDDNRLNNADGNLELKTRGEHSRYHRLQEIERGRIRRRRIDGRFT